MGTLKDLGTSYTATICPDTGYPMDEYGYLIDPRNPDTDEMVEGWDKSGTKLFNLTSPYGHLHFAIGNGDDFVCMDFRVIESLLDGSTWVIIHGTVNSETGSFIDRFEYTVVRVEDALDAAEELVARAIDWCADNNIRHSKSGWNQDVWFFLRELALAICPSPPFKVSSRMCRFGGKRVDAWIDTCGAV